MAVDRINFIPKSRRQAPGPDLQKALIYSWIGAVVLLSLMTILRVKDANAKAAHYERLAEAAKAMGASVQEVTSKVKTAEKANKRFTDMKSFLETRVTWTEALKELSLLLPNTLWLSNISTKTEPERGMFLELTGEASSQNKIASFLDALESSYFYRDVILKSSDKLDEFAPDLYRFAFEVEVPQLKPRETNAKPKK